jgi:hypothetical protein
MAPTTTRIPPCAAVRLSDAVAFAAHSLSTAQQVGGAWGVEAQQSRRAGKEVDIGHGCRWMRKAFAAVNDRVWRTSLRYCRLRALNIMGTQADPDQCKWKRRDRTLHSPSSSHHSARTPVGIERMDQPLDQHKSWGHQYN